LTASTLLIVAVLLVGSAALIAVGIIRRRFVAKAAEIDEMNRRFQATFEQAAVGVAHLDREGRWIRINARFCELTGYPPDELMALTVDDITHPLDRQQDSTARGTMMAGEADTSAVEKRYVRKDGGVIWVNATRSTIRDADGRPEFFVAVVEEITARKEAETRLTTGDAQYRAIFDSAVEAMAVIDAEGTIQSINKAVERTFGYSAEELLGRNIKVLMPDTVANHHDGYLDRYGRTGKKGIIGIGREVIGQRKDGSRFPLDLSVAEWERGGETFFTGVMRDVSARKDAEAALIAGEAQYRAIFDSAVEAMAVIDARGTIQSTNPSVERTFGYTQADLIGRNIKMLMPRTIASHHDGYLRTYRETGEKAIIGMGREVIGQRKDGSQFPLDLSVAEWERGGETFFTGVMRDVSARKDAETALRSSEESLRGLQNEFAHLARVNDLGEMAAAIAHEINQPLTAIVNFLNTGLFMAQHRAGDNDGGETERLMARASEQALRAGEIVRRLREFIGQGSADRRPEAVERLMDSAIALALIDARSNGIEVRRLSDADDAEVKVDAVQIQQVLANLMRNAVDAMLGAGRRDVSPSVTVSTTIYDDGMVEFAVSDNGPGVSSDVADRLFDPFVTTKSNGMGMGLSVCRRLIESHGGTINVESVAGEGACFSFRLPLYRAVLH
jgi:two-component system sensor kinase FixL